MDTTTKIFHFMWKISLSVNKHNTYYSYILQALFKCLILYLSYVIVDLFSLTILGKIVNVIPVSSKMYDNKIQLPKHKLKPKSKPNKEKYIDIYYNCIQDNC